MLTKVKAFVFGGVLAIAAALFLTAPVFAAPYGDGSYNNCVYTCPSTKKSEETKVTLPSGLVVSINLADGQKIPPDGYVVIVQPASGQKGALRQVGFYLDGVLQFTGEPNELGAVRWLWKPDRNSGDARIKIVITSTDSAMSTHEFTVSLAQPDPESVAAPTTEQKTNVVSTVSRAILELVGTLPAPVIHSLPYILLALLVINIVLLLIQTQRELREIAVLQRIIRRERTASIEKNAFVSLASHYLRTPLSIIQGGFDLLGHTSTLPATTNEHAQQTLESLRLKVNSLLARSDDAPQIARVPEDNLAQHSIWKNPGLYLPIILIGLFVFIFDYIAANVESFDVNQLNLIVQLVVFMLLAVVFYQVYRRHQLHKRDSEGMQRVLAHEQAINQTRDELITESAQLLGGDLQTLRDLVKDLPPSNARQFVTDGIQRFRNVLGKFAIAGQLRGGRANTAPTTTSLQTILGQLPKTLSDRLAQKNVRVHIGSDVLFVAANPQLVGYVLASLIDNAADYSADNTTITVQVQPQSDRAAITVTDHGAGISPQKIAMLFKPFSQTQDVARFTHEGMGFSLYLDKLIMTYLGGNITLSSKPNVETTATITLPLKTS